MKPVTHVVFYGFYIFQYIFYFFSLLDEVGSIFSNSSFKKLQPPMQFSKILEFSDFREDFGFMDRLEYFGSFDGFWKNLGRKMGGLGSQTSFKQSLFFWVGFWKAPGRSGGAPRQLRDSSGRAPRSVLSAAEAPRERLHHKDQRVSITT